MMRHILKMIWNRKRANALIIVEIFVAFLVLFAVCSLYIYFAVLFRHPLGYRYQDVWAVRMSFGGPWQPEMAATVKQLQRVVVDLDGVQGVEALAIPPFIHWNWTSTNEIDGKKFRTYFNRASDGMSELLDMQLLEGRWFGPEDDGVHWEPVVVNRRLATAFFGDESPLGKDISRPDPDDPEERLERRVIGVVDDFRQHGEFKERYPYCFTRYIWSDRSETAMRSLAVRVQPGTTAAFEEKLIEQLQRVAPNWTFTIKPWEVLRAEMHQEKMTPLIAVGIVTGFLMLMVGLGLLGVLWQNVTQRTQEIGLRRAMGSNQRRIYHQISGELLMVATLGLVLGTVLAAQFPMFGFFPNVGYDTYVWGLLAAAAIMYVITLICAMYPSWLATKVTPAQALHYE